MRTVFRHLWQKLYRSILAASAVFALAFSPIAAHADVYGCGTYSSDSYNSNCPSSTSSPGSASAPAVSSTPATGSAPATGSMAAESTVIQTPSGLQVAINLSDGQVIPSADYYITITPLNGAGTSFDKAEIYLDDVLVYTGTPDSTGTLKWLWDAAKYPDTKKVKIIVYGPGSDITTHEFNVTVASVQASTDQTSSNTTPTETPSTSGWPAWLVVSAIVLATLVVALIIWFIIRRRRSHQSPPSPTVFGPMQ